MTTDPQTIKRNIKSILVDVLSLNVDPAGIGDETVLFDGRLGMDSVAAIEVLTGIEEFFEIEFEDEQIGLHLFESVNTLAEAVGYLLAKRGAGPGEVGDRPPGGLRGAP